jgi:hypothetical protein
MYIGLEQVMASWGGGTAQQALYSDWNIGFFLEDFLPVADALQLRASVGYYEHLADDNIQLPTFSPFIKGSKYITATGLMNFYFGNFWLLGTSVDYGIPSDIAGAGRKQSMLSVMGRLGMRVTGFMFLLAEGGFKDYKATDVSTERMLQGYLGIRLDL